MNISTTYKWINSNQFLYFKYKTNVYITITKSKSDKSGFTPFSPSPTPHPAHLHTKYYYICCCTAYTHCSSYKKVMLKYKKTYLLIRWCVGLNSRFFSISIFCSLYCTVLYCTVLYCTVSSQHASPLCDSRIYCAVAVNGLLPVTN